MKVAIIEDEIPARQQLISLMKKLRSDIEIVNESTSVKEAVTFLQGGTCGQLAVHGHSAK